MQDALFKRIEAKRDELVALTRDLVRIPTVNPPGDHYDDCAGLISRRLAARGFAVERHRAKGVAGDSDRHPRINLIARLEGPRPGPCVHFNGHIDVVPAGQGWQNDPFAAVVRGGRIYGRGTCDMKGGLAAAIVAVEAIQESWNNMPGALEISGTADEETGGYGGVGYLAEQGYFSPPRVDHVIIPEPFDSDQICIGHRGVWWAEIETKGRIAHGSMPFLGDCAIRHMGALLARLESELFPRLAARTTAMPVVPEGARRSTLNINAVHGGLGEEHEGFPSALVPDSCRMVLDRRYLIEERPEEVITEVRALLEGLAAERPNFRYELREVMAFAPTMIEENAPVVRALEAAVAQVLGRTAERVISPGTFDQKHIVRSGLLKDCVAYGPGRLDLAHQPDEYVEIEDLVSSAKVMALAAVQLLTRGDA